MKRKQEFKSLPLKKLIKVDLEELDYRKNDSDEEPLSKKYRKKQIKKEISSDDEPFSKNFLTKQIKKEHHNSTWKDEIPDDDLSLQELIERKAKLESTKLVSSIKVEAKSKIKKEEEVEYKWWLEKPLPDGKKWLTLEHQGVVFPEPYKPHGIRMLYDGKPVYLTPEQEEVATYYAQYLESDHIKKPQFNTNFFKEFRSILTSRGPHVVQKFEKCDFNPIYKHILKVREERRNRSKEEKDKEKNEKRIVDEKYEYAIVDGHKQKIGNYRIEPPGLFLGRGDHPKAGMLKKRIFPEDVTINIGKDAKIPLCPMEGHQWGKIIHNDEVSWLAFWKDNITDGFKYVMLAASSRIKGLSDMRKFETARMLKDRIGNIREIYMKELTHRDIAIRQRATALYVIDHLALRVGNEKDEDEADTVGCCSLRVEHVKLKDPNIVDFDFLAKDSMRYQNSVTVDGKVFSNLKLFMKNKSQGKEIFDQLSTSDLNSHLKKQMERLTAKVFRTYNASITLEKELEKIPTGWDKMNIEDKMLFYNRANREVAVLCNHQRSVSKNFEEQMNRIQETIEELVKQKQELGENISDVKPSKKRKNKSKEIKKSKKQKTEECSERIEHSIKKIDERIAKWEIKKTEKDELKTVSLTTSKINYIDPRISVAWAKKYDVPIERIFSKTLRQKFPWAMDVSSDYRF